MVASLSGGVFQGRGKKTDDQPGGVTTSSTFQIRAIVLSIPTGLMRIAPLFFSRLLAKDNKGFTVLSRAEAHDFILKNQWTDCDLTHSLLFVHASSDHKFISVDFSFRDLTGKEFASFLVQGAV